MSGTIRLAICLAMLCGMGTAARAMSIDFKGVSFHPGMPRAGDRLAESVESSQADGQFYDQMSVLREDAEIAQRYPSIEFSISAFASPHECADTLACATLARRRAEMVRAFLIAHGVRPAQISLVTWDGRNGALIDRFDASTQRELRAVTLEFTN